MESTKGSPIPRKSVLVPLSANPAETALLVAAPEAYITQGHTTHFTVSYSDHLIQHPPGNIVLLKTIDGWRDSWTIIKAGNFTGRPFSDLLFYDPAATVGEFYTTEGGDIRLLKTNTGWRNSWSIITPCNLTGDRYDDLLFYDPIANLVELYTSDGHGGITFLNSRGGWLNAWSMILPCNVTGGSYTDLLFYDPAAGVGEFYTTDGHGNLTLLKRYTGWRSSWSIIVPCHISGSRYHDLVFYDPAGGLGEYYYTTDGQGTFLLLFSDYSWRNSWSILLACRIQETGLHSQLLFYDPAAGVGEFYTTNTQGHIALVKSDPTWRQTWTHILRGNFSGGPFDDLLFYDPSTGTGEFYATQGNTLAAAVLANCEQDYEVLRDYFGSTNIEDLPFSVNIHSGSNGAVHDSCGATSLSIDAFTGNDPDLTRHLVVAEVSEVFMDNQDIEWDCLASNGEGLSRVLATQLYPTGLLYGFASGASWLRSNLPDFVTNNDGSDTNYVSIGCSTLFLNYLRRQLGFNWRQIVQAGGSTLAETYGNLTGRSDAFGPFKQLLERRFPDSTSAPLITDNPFPLHPDLLFYDPSANAGEIWATNSLGDIRLEQSFDGWRSSWSQIVPGNFTGGPYSDLLFYDPSAGVGEFYKNFGQANFNRLYTDPTWRNTWSMILPGKFSQGKFTDLLFYDPSAGLGEFYTTNGQGNVTLLNGDPSWRNTWSIIVPGNFTRGNFSDLLFYDPSAGVGEFYTTDGQGQVALLQSYSGWRTSWYLIVPCNITGGQFADLLFYDANDGVVEFYKSDGNGNIALLKTNRNVSKTWSEIRAVGFALLVFYDRAAGLGEFFTVNQQYALTPLRGYGSWRTSWSIIAPGSFL